MLDVTDAGQIEAAARADRRPSWAIGGLDGLVNNAGIGVPGPLETLPMEDFRRQVEVNMIGHVAVTKAMLPAIRRAPGRIVFISSIGGRIAFPLNGAYHVAKFGIEAVGRRLPPGAEALGDLGLDRRAGLDQDPDLGAQRPRDRRRCSSARPQTEDALRQAGRRDPQGRAGASASAGSRPSGSRRRIEHALTARRPRARYLVGIDAKLQAAGEDPHPDPRLGPDRRPHDRFLSAVARRDLPRFAPILGGPIDWSISQRRKSGTEEERLRVAAVQLNSNGEKPRNLDAAERLVRAAAADGAELVALPEKWNLLAGGEGLLAGAEPLDGPSLGAARGWAARARHPPAGRQHLRERRREGLQHLGADRPDGSDLAVYRKIHMFDVDVGGVAYRESEHEQAGHRDRHGAQVDGLGSRA